jgi:drug/metabolite transporter (DMT)-like permease
MNYAISFALASLAAAGCLDVVFKGYARKQRSRGMLIFGCGLVWLVLQSAFLAVTDLRPTFGVVTVAYGTGAGILLVAANLALVESLTRLDVSLGSTIYRLNTIGVVILSFFLLSEDLSAVKLAGIGMGVAAVLLIYRRTVPEPVIPGLFVALAIVASATRAAYGVVTKAAIEAGADVQAILLLAAACWVAGGLAYAAIRERRLRITRKTARYFLLAGMLVFAVVNTLIEALKFGAASIVVPIANLSFVVAMLISAAIGLEVLNRRKWIAAALAAASIFLLAQAAA